MNTGSKTNSKLRLICRLLLPVLLACLPLRADPTLANVQCRNYGSAVKYGTEAIGYSGCDIWNQVVGGDGDGPIVVDCVDYTGASTPFVVTIDGMDTCLNISGPSDALFQSCGANSGGVGYTVSFSLPSGIYDIYLFGTYTPSVGPVQNSTFQIISGIDSVSDYSSYYFTESGEFSSIPVDGSTPLVIEVEPGSEVAPLNGIQILQHSNPTLVDVQFSDGSVVKHGTEAIGYSGCDIWNQVVDGGDGTLNCVDYTGASTPFVLTFDGMDSGLPISDSGDALFQSCGADSGGVG